MPFVIDNSVVAGWYLQDQADACTEHIAARLHDDRAIAPICEPEVTNTRPTHDPAARHRRHSAGTILRRR